MQLPIIPEPISAADDEDDAFEKLVGLTIELCKYPYLATPKYGEIMDYDSDMETRDSNKRIVKRILSGILVTGVMSVVGIFLYKYFSKSEEDDI